MEIKYYGKAWLQAFKGGFFILLGILSMLQIYGSIQSLVIFFSFFIGLSGVVSILGPVFLNRKEQKNWTIVTGIINICFAVALIMLINQPRINITMLIIIWITYNGLSEIVEAIILFARKNALGTIFAMHAMLSLLLGYAIYLLTSDFTDQRLFNVGIIALVFGVINELSAFLLNSVKKPV